MATQTSGDLQLSKPAASDLVKNFRTPYNSNMDTIDTAVTALNSKIVYEATSAAIFDSGGYPTVDVPEKSGYKIIYASTLGNQLVVGTTYLSGGASLRLRLASGSIGANMPLLVIYGKL